MLIRAEVLDRIVAGEIDTLFRRQRRPTVKTGGTLRTRVGVLDIIEIVEIEIDEIIDDDARRAGFGSVGELVAELTRKPDGTFYRVRVRLGGADPRLQLRDRDDLSVDDLARLRDRLDGFDRRSRTGPWTMRFLELIDEHPHVRAPELASQVGWETAPFKVQVRKLKELGLTISHSPGYELSPRGVAALAALQAER